MSVSGCVRHTAAARGPKRLPAAKNGNERCTAMYGHVRPCTAMYGNVRQCAAMYGQVRQCAAMCGNVRQCAAMYGTSQKKGLTAVLRAAPLHPSVCLRANAGKGAPHRPPAACSHAASDCHPSLKHVNTHHRTHENTGSKITGQN